MTAFGFFPAAGTDYKTGHEAELSARLDALAKASKRRLVGISGYRTPARSVAVGGTASDPHTHAIASDTGGAESIPDAELRKFGLYRPMTTWHGKDERNHIQLLPGTESKHLSADSSKPDLLHWLLQPPKLNDPFLGHHVSATDLLSGPAKVAGAVLKGPVDAAAQATATATVNLLWDSVAKPPDGSPPGTPSPAAKMLIYVLLVGGGLVLALAGVKRAANPAGVTA